MADEEGLPAEYQRAEGGKSDSWLGKEKRRVFYVKESGLRRCQRLCRGEADSGRVGEVRFAKKMVFASFMALLIEVAAVVYAAVKRS